MAASASLDELSQHILSHDQTHPSFSGLLTHANRNVPVRTLWRALTSHARVKHAIVPAPPAVNDASDCVRIVVISDTHNKHRTLDLPQGDLLIHCGDFTDTGLKSEVEDFCAWLRDVGPRFQHGVVVIAGNHEFSLDRESYQENLRAGLKHSEAENTDELEGKLDAVARYVRHGLIEVAGLRLFASPRLPGSAGMAFVYPRPDGHAVWASAAKEFADHGAADILVTHGPPMGHGDLIPGVGVAGCADLLDLVEAFPPTVHCYGHVHGGRGFTTNGRTLFANAANESSTGDREDEEGGAPSLTLRPAITIDVPRRNAACREQWLVSLTKAISPSN